MTSTRLLVYNYSMAKNSQVFAHQRALAIKIATDFDHTLILTSDKHFDDIPKSTRPIKIISLRWRRKRTLGNLMKLYFFTFWSIVVFRPTHVFFHMTDVHAALASPIFKLLGIRQILWYAHLSNSIWLRIAKHFVDCIVTSTSGSFPLKKSKVICVGQAVDLERFAFSPQERRNLPHVVHIGRLDRSKNIDQLLHWAKKVHEDGLILSFTLVGEPTPKNQEYWQSLYTRFRNEFDSGTFIWSHSIPHEEVPVKLQDFDLFLHAYKGSLDKALLEATAVGMSVITLNREYISEFGRWGVGALTLFNEFNGYISSSNQEIAVTNSDRRKRIEQFHSVDNWVKQVSEIIHGTDIRDL